MAHFRRGDLLQLRRLASGSENAFAQIFPARSRRQLPRGLQTLVSKRIARLPKSEQVKEVVDSTGAGWSTLYGWLAGMSIAAADESIRVRLAAGV